MDTGLTAQPTFSVHNISSEPVHAGANIHGNDVFVEVKSEVMQHNDKLINDIFEGFGKVGKTLGVSLPGALLDAAIYGDFAHMFSKAEITPPAMITTQLAIANGLSEDAMAAVRNLRGMNMPSLVVANANLDELGHFSPTATMLPGSLSKEMFRAA